MRALLVASAMCLLPTLTLAQIKSDVDPPEKIMPVPNEVVRSDHEAIKKSQDKYVVKRHETCRMIPVKPHRKHVRCS